MESCEDQDSREKVMSAITRIEGAEGKVAEVDIKDLVDKMIQEEVAAAEASFIKEQVCSGKSMNGRVKDWSYAYAHMSVCLQ